MLSSSESGNSLLPTSLLPWLPPAHDAFRPQTLPLAVCKRIASFLDPNTRFKLRALNTKFYQAFYDIHTSWESPTQVSARQVLGLASMGRVFPAVLHLSIEDDDLETDPGARADCEFCLDEGDGEFCECDSVRVARYHPGQAHGLPNLESLYISTEARVLSAFARRTTITRIALAWSGDLRQITDANFPNLRFFQLPYCTLSELPDHRSIEELRFCGLDDERSEDVDDEFERISHTNFPSLRRLIPAVNGRKEAIKFAFSLKRLYHMLRIFFAGIKVIREMPKKRRRNEPWGWLPHEWSYVDLNPVEINLADKMDTILRGVTTGWRLPPKTPRVRAGDEVPGVPESRRPSA